MKIINWNVNGLRACLKKGDFEALLTREDPDILAIEETKMQREQLTQDFPGYTLYMNSAVRKGYSGTLVLSKQKALNVTYDLLGEAEPLEGRVITLEYPHFYLVVAYVPNSKDGLKRLPYRMVWEDLLREHLKKLDLLKPVIYTGDLNVAHEEIDLKNPELNHLNAGFSDAERAKFTELLSAGFVDTFRALYPERIKYSWWSYRMRARERNVGWRIDYFVVSARFMANVVDSLIYDEIYGSDHCPIALILKEEMFDD